MIKELFKTTDTVSAPQDSLWDKGIDTVVKTSDFPTREAVVEEALRLFFEVYPQQRLEMAIGLYQDDEVTLMRAAEIAELDSVSFQEVLKKRGIVIEISGATKAEIDMGLAILRGEL